MSFTQVSRSPVVPLELECRQLRHGHAKSLGDFPQSRLECLVRNAGELLQEVPAVGIVHSADGAIGLPDQLRDKMQVAYRSESIHDRAKTLVLVHLLQIGLRQALRVFEIGRLRATDQLPSIVKNCFALHFGSLLVVLT